LTNDARKDLSNLQQLIKNKTKFMETIFAKDVPAAVGPFSHAMISQGFFYCSGQIAINPENMQLEGDDIEQQTRKVFENVRLVLRSKDLSLRDVVKVNVYLTDMANFTRMNIIYAEQFGAHKPARTTVAVAGLPLGAIIEIECIAEYRDRS
jgi:2-iminobutanoate/2-iminopropanoate deaminase